MPEPQSTLVTRPHERVWVTTTGTVYHTIHDCPMVARYRTREATAIERVRDQALIRHDVHPSGMHFHDVLCRRCSHCG